MMTNRMPQRSSVAMIYEIIIESLETFDAFFKVPDEESQDKKDASINTTLLSKTMSPFFEIECPPEHKFRVSSGTVNEDKSWSTAEMKRKF